ncbi:amino acid ABC transporter substrate-binding protein, PAAT family [Gottschalkia purinilytica]|uniref:Amino acid ABC transporter substrate-binding protein, PAAT family n=1 Tax=Gottschalkia purinilytica TaxID=1503 RepID=A0A0L0W7M6_GOTPU|nr:transporter substrate-binding domain-containing protein [Gottschalkia purinilytica]KNF07529.1 amino acid ABC transporter substrate-binding protein, PAAT family [Gottschalkia purinilytica]
MKKLMYALLLALLSITFIACSNNTQNTSSKNEGSKETTNKDISWEKIKEKGELVVGMCPEYPPFSSRNDKNEIEGFDADFAKSLGQALGVKVTLKDTAWEGLIAGLNKGDHDLVISCISPEEATSASENVNMSDKYYDLSEIIVVRNDNKDIKSKEDLKDKKIGVQANSTSEVAADSLKDKGIKVKEVKKYNRNSETFMELKNGRIDAVVVGYAYAVTQVKGNKDLKVINDPIKSVEIVTVMQKGADELTNKINEGIKKVKENGAYDKAFKKWLELN